MVRGAWIALFLLGVGCLVGSYELRRHQQEISAAHSRVDAKLVSIEIRNMRVNREIMKRYYHPIVRFETQADGKQTVILPQGSEVNLFVGVETLPLLYPTGKPQEARIETWQDGGIPALLAGGLGLALLVSGMMQFRRSRYNSGVREHTQAGGLSVWHMLSLH